LDNTSIKVLSKLQRAFPNSNSVVRGGYLRDLIIGRRPDDIDVLTDIYYKDLQKVFKELNWSDGGLELGITWTKFQNKDVQFSTVPTDDFEEELTNVDLTMNSMYLDGKEIHDPLNGFDDIKNKVIRPAGDFLEHSTDSPQSIPRVFRFSSELGFDLDEELINYLIDARETIKDNDSNRLIIEAYNIVRGEYIFKAFNFLIRTGIIEGVEREELNCLPLINDSVIQRLTMVHYYYGKKTLVSFIEAFGLNEDVVRRSTELKELMLSEYVDRESGNFPLALLLKRYLFNDDKRKVIEFMQKNK